LIAQGEGDVIEADSLLVPRPGAAFGRYAPLREETGLFLNFADTEPSRAGVLAFANRYGPLGGTAEILLDHGDLLSFPEGMDPEQIETGETLRHWGEQILWMRETVQSLKWGMATSEVLPEQFGAPPQPLWPEFYAKVNGRLDGRVAVKLLWDGKAFRSALDLLPQDLMTAMVLQLAAAVGFGKNFRKCRECGKWFELAPGLNRSSRFTCSDACRKRSYRKRRAQARAMYAGGKPFKEIAKELGSTVGTVKKWVTGRKG
jgi:hypothetical protein